MVPAPHVCNVVGVTRCSIIRVAPQAIITWLCNEGQFVKVFMLQCTYEHGITMMVINLPLFFPSLEMCQYPETLRNQELMSVAKQRSSTRGKYSRKCYVLKEASCTKMYVASPCHPFFCNWALTCKLAMKCLCAIWPVWCHKNLGIFKLWGLWHVNVYKLSRIAFRYRGYVYVYIVVYQHS